MTAILFASLTLLTPILNPVSGGRAAAFRFKQGLVPWEDWISVPGIPFTETGTFTEMTYHSGYSQSFRIISSGPTAGLNPSIGSYIVEEGYAGFLLAAGVSVSVCDMGNFSISSSYSGVTIEVREDHSRELHLLGEFNSPAVLLAGGEEAFIAGFSPFAADNFRVGPAWCQDTEEGGLWLNGYCEFGSLILETAGAVEDDNALRRARAVLSSNSLLASTGFDGEEFFGLAGIDPGLLIEWPDWGVSTLIKPSSRCLLSLSHRQGGEFTGEVQLSFHGIIGGVTLHRRPGSGWSTGIAAGVSNTLSTEANQP